MDGGTGEGLLRNGCQPRINRTEKSITIPLECIGERRRGRKGRRSCAGWASKLLWHGGAGQAGRRIGRSGRRQRRLLPIGTFTSKFKHNSSILNTTIDIQLTRKKDIALNRLNPEPTRYPHDSHYTGDDTPRASFCVWLADPTSQYFSFLPLFVMRPTMSKGSITVRITGRGSSYPGPSISVTPSVARYILLERGSHRIG